MKSKAIFFDRDGIVNVKLESDYVKSIDEFIFCDNFFPLFQFLKQQQYITVLVTNQQCVGKGIITENDLELIHNYMEEQIYTTIKYKFDAIYFCPDLANTNSKYRKPATGMFEDAIARFNIDTSKSWTIGDSLTDIIAGKQVGTRTILVDNTTKNNSYDILSEHKPDYIMQNLEEVLIYFRENAQ